MHAIVDEAVERADSHMQTRVGRGVVDEDAPVVVDGNLVTSRRPQDLPYWMREYVKLF